MAEDMPKCPPSGVINEARPEEIWSGRVSQRLRSEWQPVWIKVNKATLSSYKSEVTKIIYFPAIVSKPIKSFT